jgi:hypothetical protein
MLRKLLLDEMDILQGKTGVTLGASVENGYLHREILFLS